MVVFTWLPVYLEHERGLNVHETGWIVSISYIFATIGMSGGGWFTNMLLAKGIAPLASRKWLMTIGLILAGTFIMPAAYTPSLVLAIIFISAAMCFLNMASGLAWATVSINVPGRLVASLGSLMNCGGYLGGSVAPL
ncbi:MFS transporter [Bartonella sp. M0177]|uniref:MFS transporter n=1 Tax=Bartonella sp. M0177 TaxID=2750940 RepID=UPI0018DB608A|nr:MFS transporter [Bartonella sp. M0177]